MELNTNQTEVSTAQGPSFFPGAHGFTIENQYNVGHQSIEVRIGKACPLICQDTNHVADRSYTWFSFFAGEQESLNPIPDASYTRNRKLSPPDSSCLPGTRQDVIKTIVRWADSTLLLKQSHILWLYGYVGCGKSAIAQAVAETFAERERLAASFFFFRGSGDRRSTTRFAATIASQIATAIPSTAPLIQAALNAEVGLLEPTVLLTTQFQRLVYGPILKATKGDRIGLNLVRKPFLIVLDGLDECDDKDEISAFIEHSVDFFDKNYGIPLRILISSRVEEHIRTRLISTHQVQLLNLVDHTTSQDISTALHVAFAQAAKHSRVIQAYGEWPSPRDFTHLLNHIGCSFIFMSTIAKFILDTPDKHPSPMERLPLALNMNPGLDGLYTQTLMRSQHLPHCLEIIWTVSSVKEPLSILQLAHILEIKTFEVIAVLVNLHSIFQVPGDDTTPVTFCHTSLLEFLHTGTRSGIFRAPQQHLERLAYRCIDIIGDPNQAGSASSYASTHWQEHWSEPPRPRIYSNFDGSQKQRAATFLSHVRSLLPSFEHILATYILVDWHVLSPEEQIVCSPLSLSDHPNPDSDEHQLAAFLGAPVSHTSLVVRAVMSGGPDWEDYLELHAVWRGMKPPLPPLESFHNHILSLANTRLFGSAPSPLDYWNLYLPVYMTDNGETPSIFGLSFLIWPEHYIRAVQHSRGTLATTLLGILCFSPAKWPPVWLIWIQLPCDSSATWPSQSLRQQDIASSTALSRQFS